MLQSAQKPPRTMAQRLLTGLTVAALVLYCFALPWHMWTSATLSAERAALEEALAYARGRARLQQQEYDAAAAQAPALREALDALTPTLEEAKARETQLREQRKLLRTEVAALTDALEALLRENAALSDLIAALSEAP